MDSCLECVRACVRVCVTNLFRILYDNSLPRPVATPAACMAVSEWATLIRQKSRQEVVR
jgi:hypothetical protein